MNRIGMPHWVLGAVGLVICLGGWLVAPRLGWAVAAAGFALWVVAGTVLQARVGPALLAVVAVAAPIFALATSGRVRSIEESWPELRERLIQRASGRLDETLGAAVDQARELASLGVALDVEERDGPFAILRAALDEGKPESGVVVLTPQGLALAWAGRHRLPIDPGRIEPPELAARITSFYAVLEAHRQTAEHVSVSHVLLAADSAVPDREGTVASRFLRETGTALEFYAPRLAPEGSDVFDYCLPSCASESAVVPDTLFSVRVVPPSQGTAKLARQAQGIRWVSILVIVLLVGLGLVGGVVARWLAVVGLAALLILTPAGLHVGLGALFSPATYYLEMLGPFSASAGALFVSASVLAIFLVPLTQTGIRTTPLGLGVGVLLLAGSPLAMSTLAGGITPPTAEIGIGQWLSWEVSLLVAGVALGLASAFLLGRRRRLELKWAAWAAGGLATALGIIGLMVWQPDGGWPDWYPPLWLPAALLAVLSRPRFALLVALTVVAGSAALVLTWAATTQSRLLLAEREAGRLSGGDPVAESMLDRFADEISLRAGPPGTAAQLYAEWRRSPLSADDYPTALATWGPDGALVASLELAELEFSSSILVEAARSALATQVTVRETVHMPSGVHYVSAIPFPDSSVVTVGVAPRSRLAPPVRVARFLRGEHRLVAPYEMALGEPVSDVTGGEDIGWRRDERSTIRGTRVLELSTGSRHLHVEVGLGDPVSLLVRAALVLLFDVWLLALIWGLGEGVRGGLEVPTAIGGAAQFRSYRSRLAVALAGFFIIPTLSFAAWSAGQLRADAKRSRDLLIQQTLSDAAGTARQWQLSGLHEESVQDQLEDLGERFDADLLWYENGALRGASAPILQELGLLDAYLPSAVHLALTVGDEIEVTADELIGGRATRVGYRGLGGARDSLPVLAAPRLVDVQDLRQEQVDLAFTLLLMTIVGLGGAVGLATAAARSLAQPVETLRAAAVAVGRGDSIPPFGSAIPTEFVAVVGAFQRMARDVEASQAALEAARRRTATVLRNVATGVVALDRDMRVTIANPRAGELLEIDLHSGADVRGETGAKWELVWVWVGEFLVGERELDGREFTVGSRRIRAQIVALRTDPRGCVVALDDVTESARALRVLAWGELARQIAHEIKNPLTPIRLGVQHLLRARRDGRTDFDGALERTSRQILAEIERLDAIARAFSRFGAPPAEAAPLAAEDLVAIANDAAELYELGGGVNVRVEAGSPVEVVVRRDEVKEVLINLIENARDAGATHVTIAVLETDGRAMMTVRDDGRGIPPDVLPLVFEPQFSTTTSGTGLGLAICMRLVESWGGIIRVDSELGRGTKVTIELEKVDGGA
jgi:signal transduction histidine kinase